MWQSDCSSGVEEDSRSEEDVVVHEEDEDSTGHDDSVTTTEENAKPLRKQQWDVEDQDSIPKPSATKMKLMQWVQRPTVNTRSVTRRLYSEGCILIRPTVEDAMELREWPAEGMHERPMWPDPRYELPNSPASELELTLHHSLHAVLGYALQRARMLKTFPCSEEETKWQLEQLFDLVLNTGLLYCMANSVSQRDLATYINSLTIDSVSQWLQKV